MARTGSVLVLAAPGGEAQQIVDAMSNAVERRAYGFPFEWGPHVNEKALVPGVPPGQPHQPPIHGAGPAIARRRFEITRDVRAWWRFVDGRLQRSEKTVDLDLSIAAENFFDRLGSATQDPGNQVENDLMKAAHACENIVVVWPMTWNDGHLWNAAPGIWARAVTDRLPDLVSAQPTARRKRLIIALSRFEHALLAAEYDKYAGPTRTVRLQRALSAEKMAEYAAGVVDNCRPLRTLIEVALRLRLVVDAIPVSTRGLLTRTTETNMILGSGIEHSTEDPMLIGPDGSGVMQQLLKALPGHNLTNGLGAEYGKGWLPVFAADPFLLAAFGERHDRFVDGRRLLQVAMDRRAA